MPPRPLTAKLERFLTQPLETPFLVVDLDVVAERYDAFRDALPAARIFYAVKANPAPEVLRLLARLGSAFDIASPMELDLCLAAGADTGAISYGNTIKKSRDIAYAAAAGVRRFSVDTDAELDKVLAHAPGADVGVRLFHDGAGADWPLSRKFGCDEHDAVDLLVRAYASGAATGISFHVGSQQRATGAWEEVVQAAAMVARRATDRGAPVSFLNLGGGFPGRYAEHVPEIATYGEAIMASVGRWFGPEPPELMVEPGRYLVADAGVLRTEVVLVSRRGIDERRWIYVDCGKFNGLAETMDEAIRYRLRTAHDGGAKGPVVLAGPTCDSADVLYEKTDYELPVVAFSAGDAVDILSAGAYTTTYASDRFNGMAAPAEYYV